MREIDQITKDVLKLRQRLHDGYGLYFNSFIIGDCLQARMVEKQREEVDGVFSSYTREELIIAAEANAELELFAAEEPQDAALQELTRVTEDLGLYDPPAPPKKKPGRPKGSKKDKN